LADEQTAAALLAIAKTPCYGMRSCASSQIRSLNERTWSGRTPALPETVGRTSRRPVFPPSSPRLPAMCHSDEFLSAGGEPGHTPRSLPARYRREPRWCPCPAYLQSFFVDRSFSRWILHQRRFFSPPLRDSLTMSDLGASTVPLWRSVPKTRAVWPRCRPSRVGHYITVT
jgi:hypothetical protein